MKKETKIIIITYLAFGIYCLLDEIYFKDLRNAINQMINLGGISHILTYLISGIPILIGLIVMHGYKKSGESVGFFKSFFKGFFATMFFTLPMFIGFSIVFKFNPEMNVDDFLIKVVSAAFFEELFFRGFLFGQLFQFTKVGFIPSVFLGSLLFGFIHLYQSQEVLDSIGIFAITFLGGILFAWVYAEWNFNIWIPVFLHFFMNLSALLFNATENALGGLYFNVFRTITVILIIAYTIIYKRKYGVSLVVNKKTYWTKNI